MSRTFSSVPLIGLAWLGIATALVLTACSSAGTAEGEGENDGGEGEVGESEGEGDGAQGEGEGEGEGDGETCTDVVVAPARFDILTGYTAAEDFVFDDQGNYVGIDTDGNVVRIDIIGNTELWLPSATNLAAGMAMMANGDLIFADVELGAIMRLTEGGSLSPILGGLAYPNGLDIGTDGFIYVAENNVGRVRRVDPETGAFTVVAIGLFGPNGVALSNDPLKFYVGSFEGGGVYEVVMPSAGALGTARIYANIGGALPPPLPSCEGLASGDICVTNTRFERGVCSAIGDVLDCLPQGPCVGSAVGDACAVPGDAVTPRSCQDDGAGGLACVANNPCLGRAVDDICFTGDGQGVCAQVEAGLDCEVLSVCAGLADGGPCVQAGNAGRCVNERCDTSPCGGLPSNAACINNQGVPGVCTDLGGGLDCQADPCAALEAEDPCNNFGQPGVCRTLGDGNTYCIDACDETTVGDRCVIYGYVGECVFQGYPYCDFTAGCAEPGPSCAIDGRPGRCVSSGTLTRCETGDCQQDENGQACASLSGEGTCALDVVAAAITCTIPHPCAGLVPGNACDAGTGPGTCTVLEGVGLQCFAGCVDQADGVNCASAGGVGRCRSEACEVPGPCLALGDDCGFFGTCAQQGDALSCVDPLNGAGSACLGQPGGSECQLAGEAGRCVFNVCVATAPIVALCAGLIEGAPCTTVTAYGDISGTCTTTGVGLMCNALGIPPNECDGLPPGSPCSEGSCVFDDGELTCESPIEFVFEACAGQTEGSNCSFTGTLANYNGQCTDFGGDLVCFVEAHFLTPCNGLDDEDSCELDSPSGLLPGACIDGFCNPSGPGGGGGGGIDGIGVDACGVVYASEFTTGDVYRIVDAGQFEVLADLPSSWVPNIKWGRGLGGFASDVMYVADRDEGRLFGVQVGIEGSTEAYDVAQP